MIINRVFESVALMMAKHSSGGYMSPQDFNNYALLVQNQKLNDELKQFRTSGRSEVVSKFMVSNHGMTFVNGLSQKPLDFRSYESGYYNDFSSGKSYLCAFEELDSDEFNWRVGSELDYPTLDYPALVVRDQTIEVSPKDIDFGVITYIKNAPAPIWGYVTPVVDRYVFSETNSVDFNFEEEEIDDLTFRILKLAGIEIGSQELYTEAQNEHKQSM